MVAASTPRGTSRAHSLQRLEREAPDLHVRVLAGELSAHRAMVEAGLRVPRFTVVVSSADVVVRTLRKQLPADMLAEVADKLHA